VISDPQASEDCLLVQAVFQMGGKELTPPPDPLLAAAPLGYTVQAYVCGIDEAIGDEQTCMGALVSRPAISSGLEYALVLRGTAGQREWAEDSEFILTAYPLAGRVESGFFDVYHRLSAIVAGETQRRPLLAAVQAVLPAGACLRVVGHSLGAAVATHAALDLALLMSDASRISATLIASPHVGDAEFDALFDRSVARYKSYGREFDVVPHIPAGFGYAHPANMVWMKRANEQAVISLASLADQHHALVYGAALYYNLIDWKGLTGQAAALVAAILGPNPLLAAAA